MSSSASFAPSRPPLLLSLAVGSVFAAVFTAFGSFNMFNGESAEFGGQELVNWFVCIAGIVVAALVCWRASEGAWARGEARALASRSLIFGTLALASLPVFWLGVYGPFAAGSIAMGGTALRTPVAGTGSKVAALFGVLLALGGTFVCALNNVIG